MLGWASLLRSDMKEKIDTVDFIKIKTFWAQKETIKKIKRMRYHFSYTRMVII